MGPYEKQRILRNQIIEELTTEGKGDQYSSTALLVANRARREWEEVAMRWRADIRRLEQEVKELRAKCPTE